MGPIPAAHTGNNPVCSVDTALPPMLAPPVPSESSPGARPAGWLHAAGGDWVGQGWHSQEWPLGGLDREAPHDAVGVKLAGRPTPAGHKGLRGSPGFWPRLVRPVVWTLGPGFHLPPAASSPCMSVSFPPCGAPIAQHDHSLADYALSEPVSGRALWAPRVGLRVGRPQLGPCGAQRCRIWV